MDKSFDWKWFLLSFDGRTGRSDYWLRFNLPVIVISAILGAVEGAANGGEIGLLSSLFMLAALWPSWAVGVKRCHDRDRSGWFLLIGLIPIVGGIWLLVELGFLRGTIGPNKYGPDPLHMMAPAAA
ncbi:MAG: DUF805 domain-containing protein [Rhodospirillales bacterium]